MKKQNEQRLVPQLRFKGFNEDWEQCKLKDILKVNSGRNYKHLAKGDIPVYGTGGLIARVDDFLSNQPAVGLGRKGTIDNPFFLEPPFWTVDTLFYLTSEKDNHINFIFYLLLRIRWKKYDESTGVPSLSKKTIENINVFSTKFEEQIKIAKILEKINDLINLHKRKLKIIDETIHELREQLFSTKYIAGKKVKSEKMKLNDFLEEVIEHSNKENQYPLLSSTNNGIETRSGRVSGSSNIGYKILRKNQLVLSPQNLWLGNININRDFEVGIVSPSYKVFDIKNIKIIYLENILKTERMKYNFDKISIQGASVVRRNLDMKEFLNLEVRVTQKNEQEKLVKTFVQLRNIKFSLRSKIKILEKLKILYLDKMFI